MIAHTYVVCWVTREYFQTFSWSTTWLYLSLMLFSASPWLFLTSKLHNRQSGSIEDSRREQEFQLGMGHGSLCPPVHAATFGTMTHVSPCGAWKYDPVGVRKNSGWWLYSFFLHIEFHHIEPYCPPACIDHRSNTKNNEFCDLRGLVKPTTS